MKLNIFFDISERLDMGLYYSNLFKSYLIGYVDGGYLSNPHKARPQTCYLFTYGGTATSWRSIKQTLVASSSNHAEILAIHEASSKCVWLRSITQHIREACGLPINKEIPTTL